MDFDNPTVTAHHLQRAKAVQSLWKTVNEEYQIGSDFVAAYLSMADRVVPSRGLQHDYMTIATAFIYYENRVLTRDFWEDLTKSEPRLLEFNSETFKEAVRLAHLENNSIYFTDFYKNIYCSSAAPILVKYKELIASSTTI